MDVQQWEAAGTGHDWGTVTAALAHVMPWMATRMNLDRDDASATRTALTSPWW